LPPRYLQGKVVRVVGTRRYLDESALEASLSASRFFSDATTSGEHFLQKFV